MQKKGIMHFLLKYFKTLSFGPAATERGPIVPNCYKMDSNLPVRH